MRTFDIRRLIGGLFLLYGLALAIAGTIGSAHVRHKAAGINIDLWTGLGMLLVAGGMLAWARWAPLDRSPTAAATRDRVEPGAVPARPHQFGARA